MNEISTHEEQLSFLGFSPSQVKIKSTAPKQLDWQNTLAHVSSISQQQSLLNNNDVSSVLTYCSGVSSISDLKGYIRANTAIGINVIDTSKNGLACIKEYLSKGGRVFSDSGAFRNFKAKCKDANLTPINFDVVLSHYSQMSEGCPHPQNLMVAAPDIVGDQQGSFDLLISYKREIQQLMLRGVQVMIAMQKGEISLDAHYKRCIAVIGEDIVVGLPSNAKAVCRSEVLDFIERIKPNRVHFLGCSERGLLHEVMHKSPGSTVTCDATKIRKHVGKNRLLTQMHNDVLDEVICHALQGREHNKMIKIGHWDETEIIGDLLGFLPSLTIREFKHFATEMNTSVMDIEKTEDNDELWELLDEVNYGYAYQLVSQYLTNFCRKKLSPNVRTTIICELAIAKVI